MDATKPLRRQHSLRTMKRKNRKQDNVCSLLLCSPASPESLSHSNYHAKYIWNEHENNGKCTSDGVQRIR